MKAGREAGVGERHDTKKPADDDERGNVDIRPLPPPRVLNHVNMVHRKDDNV